MTAVQSIAIPAAMSILVSLAVCRFKLGDSSAIWSDSSEGQRHRVTTPEKPRKIPRTPVEPRRAPQNPRRDPVQSPLRGKVPWRASRRVVPLGWWPSRALEFESLRLQFRDLGSSWWFSMGGVEKRGGWKTSRMTPLPKRDFGPPSYGTFSTPLRCQCSVFPVQNSTTEQTRCSFGGVQKFSGERVLWYVFLPPYVLHPPISRPKSWWFCTLSASLAEPSWSCKVQSHSSHHWDAPIVPANDAKCCYTVAGCLLHKDSPSRRLQKIPQIALKRMMFACFTYVLRSL